ncbi:hypothetical protein H0H93_009551 [Arthromyces matolae]|nr:hypothetical protein H0H93_009551 [Arthromyces matolae]
MHLKSTKSPKLSLGFIDTLPLDVLSKIFEMGKAIQKQDNFDGAPRSQVEPSKFEMLVSHVSTHFREVAIGTPRLWGDIDILSSNGSPESITELNTYLSRSAACELEVRIEAGSATPISQDMLTKIETVTVHSERYSQLIITSCDDSAQLVMQYFNNAIMPRLHTLSVTIDSDGMLGSPSVPLFRSSFGIGASRLSFLRLRGLALLSVEPPLQNVTTLHLDQTAFVPIRHSTFQKMLTLPSTLQHLSVYGDLVGTADWHKIIRDPIHIPTLQCLRISGVNREVYTGLLCGIVAPSLASLVLKDLDYYDLLPFLTTSSSWTKFSLLRELVVIDCQITGDEYMRLFRTFPHLLSLGVYHRKTPQILCMLSEDHDDGYIPWPKLHTLSLIVDDDDDHIVADIVQQRQAIGRPLSRIRLGWTEPLSLAPDIDWLQRQLIVEQFEFFDSWPTPDFMDLEDILFQ